MAQKPSIPKGTRDFSATEMARRNYIFDTISQVYKLFGFQQIETPAMENLSTLMGKYGEEGDKLLFKILNSGDFLSGIDRTKIQDIQSQKLTSDISEKGLRYDLTVPFARYVVMHRNEIQFPFKRFQIQPVWRADRPQKGRYREFYQCDADIIGSQSLLNEIELIQMIDEVFKRLNINVVIKINNRKILAGIAEYIGAPEHLIAITVALDKLDKIGEEAVINEMIANGISTSSIEKLKPLLKVQNQNNADKLEYLKQFLLGLPIGMKGIEEMEEIFAFAETIKLQNKIQLDLTLARGLNYYTGAIFEVAALDVKMGSICGGGRYDNLTGIFGMPDVSGVGISFGADRIYDVLLELDGFPKNQMQNTSILIVNFGGSEAIQAMSIATALRNAGISCMLFPETIKIAKQFNFANVLQIPYVLIAGSNEVETGKLNLKDMNQGTQELLFIDQIIEKLQNH